MPGRGMMLKQYPVYLKNVERRPLDEHTLNNKEIAVSYAAYGQ